MSMPSIGNVVFTRHQKPLSEADIVRFEGELGSALPTNYRTFLLRTNGGHPHKHLLPQCYVQGFFAITSANQRLSLEAEIEKMADALPRELIPIGYTGTSDRICLLLSNDEIYLWEHERQYELKPCGLGELMFLAEDIFALVAELEGDDPPDPDDEAGDVGRWGDITVLDDYLNRGNDINVRSARGGTVVRSAVYAGHLDFVKYCKRRGAILKGQGLLHAAMFGMDYDMVTFLLEEGLDPNERDDRGLTPLDIAPPPALGPAVQLLVSKGGVKSAQ